MKIKFSWVLVLILSLVSASFAYDSSKETELLFMAKKAYEDGFYEVSLGMLEKFQKDFSESSKISEARLLSGQCYFNQGRYLEALNIFEKLLSDPRADNLKDALYFWIAEVHFKGSNFEKAAQLYQKLINEFPLSSYSPAAYYSLGWSFSQISKFDQAAKTFEALLAKFPNEPQSKDAAFKLIECLYNLKKYSELKNKINPVFKLYANDALRLSYLYFYLAESEYYLDRFEEAAEFYIKSGQILKDQKIQVLAKLGLGWSYLKLTKYKKAEEALADIKQSSLDKKSFDIFLLAKALLMSATNRAYEAKKLYEQLISASSDPSIRAQAYLGKADTLYNLAEYTQAIQAYKEGLDKVNKSVSKELIGRILYNLASSYEATGELIEAKEVYTEILELYPDSANADYALYQLGLAQLKNSNYEEAIDLFKSLPKKYPQSKFLPDGSYSLGTVYFQKADYLSSLEIFSKFQKEFKDSPLGSKAYYMLGASLVNLGKTDEALIIFKDILRLFPQDTQLIQKAEYEIADCYYKLGQDNEALNRFKLLRTKYPNADFAPLVMWWLGQYYYRYNDLNLAQRYFDSLVKDFPNNRLTNDAFYALGLIFSDENKLESAVDNFKMAIKFASPELKTKALAALAKSYYKLGDYDEAKSFYSQCLATADVKDIPDLRFGLAETLEAKSEADEAIAQYLLAADLYTQVPLCVQALLRAARLYEDKEDFKEALKIYERIIDKGTEEAKFAQERIEWIKANIK